MSARSKLQGWGDAALDAAIVASVGVGVSLTGLDKVAAQGISMLAKNTIPSFVLRPIILGATIGLTVFIYDLVIMYKFDYNL